MCKKKGKETNPTFWGDEFGGISCNLHLAVHVLQICNKR